MKEMGITSFKPNTKKQRKLRPIPQPTIDSSLKTPLMRYLELIHGEPIEQILLSGSLSVVAKKLDNEVDTSTLSRWIKRLKLRYSVDNLPNCNGCRKYGPACESGVCYLLIELERYDLLEAKKVEVLP
ncbi:hypothetical protein LCGC14_0383380 [marine sediment metagenome]|uniref:Uncharacterized protein n=1 Tax=marine sediment metagenome TaxID=412755 RepID=A0A0F9T7L3_9ZZZZ